jgi:ribonuclease HII
MIIAGVDEAGRGPLAGPVVAAAVVLGAVPVHGLADSKSLSAKRRAALEAEIRAHCAFGIGQASVEEIDTFNILQATLLAMRRAVEALPLVPELILVDGNKLPHWEYKAQAIVRGDALHSCISAASILAKEYRDHIMQEAHAQYPQYGWDKNKGYGSAAHMQAIRTHGTTPLHRALFVRKILLSSKPTP